MTPSASGASSRPFIPVTDDPGAASIIAETMTKTKEVYFLNSLRLCPAHTRLCHILEPRCFPGLRVSEQSDRAGASVPRRVHKPARSRRYSRDGGSAQIGSVLSLWWEGQGGAVCCAVWHGYSLSTGDYLRSPFFHFFFKYTNHMCVFVLKLITCSSWQLGLLGRFVSIPIWSDCHSMAISCQL